ncbi:hypothetical protein BCR34DRAFT_595140 [Clohesyomyces aquaticus]|uniref:Uncharacterized protein n=1 Tax=Clohesyomyces aquaticus TaxID=1231657 RepID=A0A1Y2AAY7_9PLEO|nr:hypothetical protein BCR34DRAFT_595140 [Clohesyomyces aquaticus]
MTTTQILRSMTPTPIWRFASRKKRLVKASPVFAASLPKASNSEQPKKFKVPKWNPPVFLAFPHAIHNNNRTSRVPLENGDSLSIFARIAVLVDHYECPAALSEVAPYWIEQILRPTTYGRRLMMWMTVYCVFGLEAELRVAVRVATKGSLRCERGAQTLGLPIPEEVVRAIEKRRIELWKRILAP